MGAQDATDIEDNDKIVGGGDKGHDKKSKYPEEAEQPIISVMLWAGNKNFLAHLFTIKVSLCNLTWSPISVGH